MGTPGESRLNFGGKCGGRGHEGSSARVVTRANGRAYFLVATFFEDPPSDFFELDPLSDFVLDPESDFESEPFDSELFESEPFESEPFDSEDELDAELSDFSLLRRDELGLSVL